MSGLGVLRGGCLVVSPSPTSHHSPPLHPPPPRHLMQCLSRKFIAISTHMQLIGLKSACPVTGLGGEVGGQPRYMQMAPPPVHPGAPVTDRGFTGPGGAAGGARRRLAGKLFERQHSLQDPSFDPVSQHLGMDEVIPDLAHSLPSMYGSTCSCCLLCNGFIEEAEQNLLHKFPVSDCILLDYSYVVKGQGGFWQLGNPIASNTGSHYYA